MNAILDFFAGIPTLQAVGWLLLENVCLFFFSLLMGDLVVRLFVNRRISPAPPPLTRGEIGLAALTVLMNTIVTVAGWWLWRNGFITLRRDYGPRAWLDVIVLLMAMDLAMYVTHRLAHWPPAFRILHAAHHRYDHPRPLNLFVLHPLEVLGFGALWLSIMWLYPASWLGTSIYLTLNLVFGTLGHVGVEPFPRSWAGNFLLRHVGTSTFHAEHHLRLQHNYGFYTLLWDRMFGTLDPSYRTHFESATVEAIETQKNPVPSFSLPRYSGGGQGRGLGR